MSPWVFSWPKVRLVRDRKSTRLNSSHLGISYAVFCLKKKKTSLILDTHVYSSPCESSLRFSSSSPSPHTRREAPGRADEQWSCLHFVSLFFFNDTATTEIYTLSLHDALPISLRSDSVEMWGLGSQLFRSLDNGTSWEPLTAYRTQSVVGPGMHSVAVSPRDPDQIAVANDY